MPPKTKFTREDVIQAAFKIVRRKGLHALTARRVAGTLNSSTAPVYSCFRSMEVLKKEVLKRAKDLLFQYSTKPYTDRVFLNMGTGYAIFARDESELFKAMFLESSNHKDIVDEFLKSLKKEMIKDQRFTTMPAKNRNALLNLMWIFAHGLASLICVGIYEDKSNKYIIDKLLEVGKSVIGTALAESQKQP